MTSNVPARKRILDAMKEIRGQVPRQVLNKSMLGRMDLNGWFLVAPALTIFLGPNKIEAVRTLHDITPELWTALDKEPTQPGNEPVESGPP